jgi:hypothetical protein
MKIMATKNVRQQIFYPPLGSGMGKKIRIRGINIPDPRYPCWAMWEPVLRIWIRDPVPF